MKYFVLKNYVLNMIYSVPLEVYAILICIFFIGVILIVGLTKREEAVRYISFLALIEYLILVFYSTVYCRATKEIREFNFHPFWSYEKMGAARPFVLSENLLNVAVFIPIGFLIRISFRRINWWKCFFLGLLLSVCIEFLQFFLMRGFAEFDDVIHNTIGCAIGIFVFEAIRSLKILLNKK